MIHQIIWNSKFNSYDVINTQYELLDRSVINLKKSTPLDGLKPMTDDIVAITTAERLTRIEKTKKLMAENKIEALILDAGTSLKYFTGIYLSRNCGDTKLF